MEEYGELLLHVLEPIDTQENVRQKQEERTKKAKTTVERAQQQKLARKREKTAQRKAAKAAKAVAEGDWANVPVYPTQHLCGGSSATVGVDGTRSRPPFSPSSATVAGNNTLPSSNLTFRSIVMVRRSAQYTQ